MYAGHEFEQSVEKEVLFGEFLASRTTAADLFRKVNDFMTSNELKRQSCVEVFADRAAALTSKQEKVVTRIKEIASKPKFTHCSIYRDAAKAMPSSLKTVLDR